MQRKNAYGMQEKEKIVYNLKVIKLSQIDDSDFEINSHMTKDDNNNYDYESSEESSLSESASDMETSKRSDNEGVKVNQLDDEKSK